MKRAFITGITGQDGSYLCEALLAKDDEVHGLVHRPDYLSRSNTAHLVQDPKVHNKTLFLHNGAFEDATHLLIGGASTAHGQGSPSGAMRFEEPDSCLVCLRILVEGHAVTDRRKARQFTGST